MFGYLWRLKCKAKRKKEAAFRTVDDKVCFVQQPEAWSNGWKPVCDGSGAKQRGRWWQPLLVSNSCECRSDKQTDCIRHALKRSCNRRRSGARRLARAGRADDRDHVDAVDRWRRVAATGRSGATALPGRFVAHLHEVDRLHARLCHESMLLSRSDGLATARLLKTLSCSGRLLATLLATRKCTAADSC